MSIYSALLEEKLIGILLTMKKIYVIVIGFLAFASISFGYDLLDLRIIPSFTTGRLLIDGYISEQNHTENGSRRRDRIRSMYPEWLHSGEVTIKLPHGEYKCNVNKGHFSTEILSPKSIQHISIYYKNEKLYSEIVNLPKDANYLVVSDVDDTILESSIGNMAKMVYKGMLLSVKKRKQIKGTSQLYKSLQNGNSKLGNPLFAYLSGSPAALSRSVKSFLKINEFPYGITIFKKSFWSSDTSLYKIKWLKNLSSKFQNYPMILFGDSGEKDPFIYNSFALQHPGVVKAIIIHEVTGRLARIKTLEWFKKKSEKTGCAYIIWNNEKELLSKMKKAGLLTK